MKHSSRGKKRGRRRSWRSQLWPTMGVRGPRRRCRLPPPPSLRRARRGRLLARAGRAAQAAEAVPGEVVVKREGAPAQVLKRRRRRRAATVERLRARRRRRLRRARTRSPRAAAFVPERPRASARAGRRSSGTSRPGQRRQRARRLAARDRRRARPAARGVTIAVLDSGVAYADRGRFRRSPDLDQTRFAAGYDFVDRDRYPQRRERPRHARREHDRRVDEQRPRPDRPGLRRDDHARPRARPQRRGRRRRGSPQAVRCAVRQERRHHQPQPRVRHRRRRARHPVAARRARLRARAAACSSSAPSGNEGDRVLAFPARSANVFAVGATTEHGCLSDFSNLGRGLDIVAPGGGTDAALDDPNCQPGRDRPAGRSSRSRSRAGRCGSFGLPGSFEGTSMAAPHVPATAALVIATPRPRPAPDARADHRPPPAHRARPRRRRAPTRATARACSTPPRRPSRSRAARAARRGR